MPNDNALINWGHLTRFASNLKDRFELVEHVSSAKINSNMYLTSELISGYGYSKTGALTQNASYCATPLYPRNEDCYIISSINAYRICRYDANKNFLGYQDGGASVSATGEYVSFMYPATTDLTNLEIKNIKNGWQKTDELFEIKGKNLFQKDDLLYGYGYRSADGTKVEDGRFCITPIYERKPDRRLQSNISFYRAIVFNSDKTFKKVIEGVHNVGEGKYVAFMYTVGTDLSELMICNTKAADIQGYKKPTYSPSDDVMIKDDGSVYNTDNLLHDATAYVNNDVDDIPYVTFAGTTGSKIWIEKDIPCGANKILNIEFNASSNANDDYTIATGGALYVKFYDNEDVVINNNKYNMSVIKNDYFGYHKYSIAAPRGTAYAKITLFTRGATTIRFKYLNISIVNHVIADGISVKYDGHLGNIYSAPKNTMPAFETAYRMGYRSIITVPRYTKDGVMVALHDQTIDATSDGTGNVDSYDYDELLEFDFGSWFSKYYTGTKIPKIESVMKFAKISGMEIILSLHDKCMGNDGINELYTLAKKYGLLNNIMFKSYFIDELDDVHDVFGNNAKYDYIISSYTTTTQSQLTARNYINYVEMDNLSNLTEQIAIELHGMGIETISPIIANGIDIHKSIDLGCSRFTSDHCANVVLPF